tara:strand:+ start:626 stop:832 length:207 start_codon:yes stop_codon:yes gene_type:complete
MKKLVDGQYIEMTTEEVSARESQITADTSFVQSILDVDAQKETDKANGKAKLKELGLTDAQIKALVGE